MQQVDTEASLKEVVEDDVERLGGDTEEPDEKQQAEGNGGRTTALNEEDLVTVLDGEQAGAGISRAEEDEQEVCCLQQVKGVMWSARSFE